jgi:hypothetical protein
VVEHHHGVGHGTGQLGELTELEVVVPRVVGEPSLTETGEPGTERWVGRQASGRTARDPQFLGVLGVSERVADPPEQPMSGFGVRIEHLVELSAETEIGTGHDAGDQRP